MQELELEQVSIWEVIEPTKIMKKEQKEISKIKFSWYRGGFFEINAISCNCIYVEIQGNIKKVTYIIDRYGSMDQIVLETEILKPTLFWKNINKIIYSDIEINIPKNVFIEDKFCIKANDERILTGPYISKKRDKDLTKFLKYIDIENVFTKMDELLKKYKELK